MGTIARNRTKLIEDIKARFTVCVIRSADSSFRPIPKPAETAWSTLATVTRAKLIEEIPGKKYVIETYKGLLWYELTAPVALVPGVRVFCKSPDVTHGAHAIIAKETYVSPIDGEWEGHALVAWGLSGYELSTGAHVREHMKPDDGTCPEHFTCSLCRYPEQADRVRRRLGIDPSSLQV